MRTRYTPYYSGNTYRQGFTIVELLIVVVVIAILAAITIVSYNGITRRAKEVGVQTDTGNGATTLESRKVIDGSYPIDCVTAGVKVSAGNSIVCNTSSTAFCNQVTRDNISYFASNEKLTPRVGYCDGILGIEGSAPAGPVSWAVTTLAGSSSGYNDATGAAAQFRGPFGVAIDSSGTLYVADTSNHRIRKVTSGGAVTTLAGSTAGFANGSGAAAQFNYPQGVALDSAGTTLYVADFTNHRIRKVTSGGAVTTLAGSTVGYTDATGTAAQFNSPSGVAVDSSGTVYVADSVNDCIRKITPGGVVTTFAGSGTAGTADGTGTAAQFDNPQGITLDSSGTLYVADVNNNLIRKITSGGVVTTLAGSTLGYADGVGAAAQFSIPAGIAVDTNGMLYVTDEGNHRIRKVSPGGVVTTIAGSGTFGTADGTGTAAQFFYPIGIGVSSSGTVYVGDNANTRVRKIVPQY